MIDLALSLARDRLTPAQFTLAQQFAKFAVVGGIGFVCDTGVIYALAPFVGPYWAGTVSFIIVGSLNWLLNRIWTYRHLQHTAPHRQVVAFLAANAVGFVLNRGTYFTLVATVPFCHAHLVVPVAAAAGAGMFVNFFLSRRLVFRE
jgi:putative flippase GtrA